MQRTQSLAVVTGGSGFIGSHVVEELLARGLRVRCIVRSDPGWLRGLPVEIVATSLMDIREIEKAIAGAEYFLHVAGTTKAKSRAAYRRGNVETTENLLSAAARTTTIRKFCLVSSQTAVGPNPDGLAVDERTPCNPLTAYGKSKREAEILCESFATRLPTVIVRLSAVYGPRDRDIFELFRWVGFGIKPVIGAEEKRLSLAYAPDVAKGIAEATLSERTNGETYFVADPVVHTLSEQVSMIAELVHRKPVAVRFPAALLYAVAGVVEAFSFFGPRPAVLSVDKARDMLQAHWECSPEKIRRDIGFVCPTPLREGLQKTYHWYREMGWL